MIVLGVIVVSLIMGAYSTKKHYRIKEQELKIEQERLELERKRLELEERRV